MNVSNALLGGSEISVLSSNNCKKKVNIKPGNKTVSYTDSDSKIYTLLFVL